MLLLWQLFKKKFTSHAGSYICRLLFEESKKRSEAVVDKVRAVKRIHKNISENAKELRREV